MSDTQEIVDQLYACWAKTTGSESSCWQVRGGGVVAVDHDQSDRAVGGFLDAVDAEFIAAVHTCLPELVRRVNEALDEADRADADRDGRECRIAELELEVAELKKLSTL